MDSCRKDDRRHVELRRIQLNVLDGSIGFPAQLDGWQDACSAFNLLEIEQNDADSSSLTLPVILYLAESGPSGR